MVDTDSIVIVIVIIQWRKSLLNIGGDGPAGREAPCPRPQAAGGGSERGSSPPSTGVRGYNPRENFQNLLCCIMHFNAYLGP